MTCNARSWSKEEIRTTIMRARKFIVITVFLALILPMSGMRSTGAAAATTEQFNFRPELTGVHPRLLIHSEMQPELERRASDPNYEYWYEKIIQKTESAPQTVDWFDPNVPDRKSVV